MVSTRHSPDKTLNRWFAAMRGT
ncbi:unnamed protein product [Spirodela intermedia]|uniref:Uncharacterized protein n=2 Tax=Spirodela intermedia TaxID=51605 RepID=A0A7I8KH44_SPIIN|nr:unnamed protein product [Spirodela intermedia]CAA6660083.1 unnamed protein product [Spirodela intermedia]CAA7396398.1 unnamed protein product [Spirodela intermedia]